MSAQHRRTLRDTDPSINIQLPIDLLEDLLLHADIQGLSIEYYVAKALRNALENVDQDLEDFHALNEAFLTLTQRKALDSNPVKAKAF